MKKKANKKNKISRISRIEKTVQRLAEENRRASEELRNFTMKNIEELRKTSEELKTSITKTSEEIRALRESVAALTDSWGRFVEGIVEPSAVSFMTSKGFNVRQIHSGLKVSRDGKNAEYDILIVCDKVMLLVSCKTRVKSQDIKELLDDIKELFYFLPEYKGKKLWGAIAGMSFGTGSDTFAKKSGIIVMKPSGEIMKVEVPKRLREIS